LSPARLTFTELRLPTAAPTPRSPAARDPELLAWLDAL
jgi:hypothetical protein